MSDRLKVNSSGLASYVQDFHNVPDATPVGKAGAKGILGKTASLAGRAAKGLGAGTAALSAVFGASDYIAGRNEGLAEQRELQRLKETYIPTAEDLKDSLVHRNEAENRLNNMDPETLEDFRWLLSGQQQLRLTADEVAVGNVPHNQGVTEEDMIQAMMAMMEDV